MIPRKPLAPNNRLGGRNRSAFLASLESEAIPSGKVKSNERSVIFHYLRPGRQNSEGFGGGRLIQK
jgi:hypothetical protein